MMAGGAGVTVRRWWRGLRGQAVWVQAVAVIVVVAVIAGAVVGVAALAPSSSSDTASTKTTPGKAARPSSASDTAPGVTKDSIHVVFPSIDSAASGQAIGLAGGTDEKDQPAIKEYVDDINEHGGIDGRKLVADIVPFNPLDAAGMQAHCKDWSQSKNVFAVIDTGAWYSQNQLCLTQDGHVPLISGWTTVTEWTTRGAPYLWWTGPDQADVVKNLVPWGIQQKLLGPDTKLGIVVGDRESDKLALNEYLLPALEQAGITPADTDFITANVGDSATAQAQAKGAVQRLQAAGVTTVLPLLPANSLFQYFAAANDQKYAPKLMLSDYESNISVAIGLAEFQFPNLVSGQLGTTVFTYGSTDDPRPDIGYSPGAMSCYDTWKANHHDGHMEAQGPRARWCQSIRLFATAARKAGKNLTRRSFVEALSSLKDAQAVLVPAFTFGPTRHSGVTKFRTVKVVKNDMTAAGNICPLKPSPEQLPGAKPFTDAPDSRYYGSCWLIVSDFTPMQG
jgi:ABC-type branched-subunit amino acid transport system substrate-binding protein